MKYGCLQFATIFVVIVIFCVPQLACEGFVAGALVKAVNAYVPIETLQVGDEVSCYDGTGTVAVEKITATHLHKASSLIKIFLKHETFVCDCNQLFYCGAALGWCKASELKVGDIITSFVQDDSGLVCNIEFLDHDDWVYALTVANNHNFYISQSGFLVHNMAVSVAVPFVINATFVTVVETGAVLGLVAKWIYNFWSTGSFKSAHSSSKRSSSQGNNLGSSNNNKCFCGHSCGAGCACGCLCGCGKTNGRNINKNQKKNDDEKNRKKNEISKAQYFDSISQQYQPFENGAYKLRKGAQSIVGAYYLKWDFLHGEVEAYNQSEEHLGAINPLTNRLYKPAVPGRTLR